MARPSGGARDHNKLSESGDDDRAREQVCGALRCASSKHQHKCDCAKQDKIECDDTECRGANMPLRIERGRRGGDETSNCDVWRGQPQQRHRGGEAGAVIIKSRQEQLHDDRGKHDTDQRDKAQHQSVCGEHVPGEAIGITATLPHTHPYRHERCVERAVGHQATKEIGNLQRGKIRIGQRTGAEYRGYPHIAQKAEQARGQRRRADRSHVAHNRHDVSHRRSRWPTSSWCLRWASHQKWAGHQIVYIAA